MLEPTATTGRYKKRKSFQKPHGQTTPPRVGGGATLLIQRARLHPATSPRFTLVREVLPLNFGAPIESFGCTASTKCLSPRRRRADTKKRIKYFQKRRARTGRSSTGSSTATSGCTLSRRGRPGDIRASSCSSTRTLRMAPRRRCGGERKTSLARARHQGTECYTYVFHPCASN